MTHRASRPQGKRVNQGKKVKGRKRHRVTAIQGHLLHIKVPAANIHDAIAGCGVFEETIKKYPALKGVCANVGCRKTRVHFVEKALQKTIEISERIAPVWAGSTMAG